MRPQTRDRVLQAIRDLSYAPVKAAQTLRRVRTRTLGILLPDITNLYFALLARGVESVAFETGYTTIICDSDHQSSRESQYLEMLRSEDVEGIVFVTAGTPDPEALDAVLRQGIRVVAADRRIQGVPTVEIDNYRASFDLTRHVLDLGYRRVAYIAGPDTATTSIDRLAGCEDALAAHGLVPVSVLAGDFTVESGAACARRILEESDVDVVFAANDLMAFGVLGAAEEIHLNVPNDLGVAGFDHVPQMPYSALMRPDLTTVEVPVRELGRSAATLLLEGDGHSVQLDARLIVGGTCQDQSKGVQ